MTQNERAVTVNQGHRRVNQTTRTKNDIITATFLLLQQEKFGNIKVGQIADKAGYSRRTFYRHFDSPMDVIKTKLTELVLALFTRLRKTSEKDQGFDAIVHSFFDYWAQQKPLLFLLEKQGLIYLLAEVTDKNLSRSKLSEELAVDRNANVKFESAFATAGMYALLCQWLKEGATKSPGQMALIAQNIRHHMAG